MAQQSKIKVILRAWARWHCSGNGYPGINSIMLARDGFRAAPPGSRPPRAVEPPEDVAQVMQGMMVFTLEGGSKSAAMAAVRSWYLRGHNARVKDVANELDIKSRTLADNKRRGEILLDGWIAGWRNRQKDRIEYDATAMTT